MKVILLVARSGRDGSFNAGAEVDVDDAEARRMIDAGQAVPARAESVERAVPKAKTEKAVR